MRPPKVQHNNYTCSSPLWFNSTIYYQPAPSWIIITRHSTNIDLVTPISQKPMKIYMEIKRRELQSHRGERQAQRASAHVTCKSSGDLLAGWHCRWCGTLCPQRTSKGDLEKGGPPWFGRVSWGSPRTSPEKGQPRWREKQRKTLEDKRTYHMAWSLICLKKSWTAGDTGATSVSNCCLYFPLQLGGDGHRCAFLLRSHGPTLLISVPHLGCGFCSHAIRGLILAFSSLWRWFSCIHLCIT